MKFYDFNKALSLIEENKENITSATLGMHEDWFWTADEIYNTEDGFTRELFAGDLQKERENYDKDVEERGKEGARFNDILEVSSAYKHILIAGICGSSWATPTLQLIFKDGSDKMFPCFTTDGQEMPFEEKVIRQATWVSGCLSSPFQDSITPLEQE